MSPTVYVVSGATRGIGFEMVSKLSARPDTLIFAGTRTFPLPADHQLARLAARLPEVVIPIQLDSADEAGNAAAAKVVEEKAGKVDIIIANAGINPGLLPLSQVDLDVVKLNMQTNAFGVFVLYRAFYELLHKADTKAGAKFAVISSMAGAINDMSAFPFGAYGMSKAAVNYLTKKIDLEDAAVTAFPIHPGVVNTDMGRDSAEFFGIEISAIGGISVGTSADGVLALVDAATKETHGGKFWNYTGEPLAW